VTFGEIIINQHDVFHQRTDAECHYGTMSVPADEFPFLYGTIIGREFLEEQVWKPIVRPVPALMSRLLALHSAMECLPARCQTY
jgi:hypothetical protein